MIVHLNPLITLIFSLITGLFAALHAHKRKKNPYTWFFIGFLFGIFGLFYLFYTPAPKRQRKRGTRAPVAKPSPTLVGPADKFWYYLDPTHQQMAP